MVFDYGKGVDQVIGWYVAVIIREKQVSPTSQTASRIACCCRTRVGDQLEFEVKLVRKDFYHLDW